MVCCEEWKPTNYSVGAALSWTLSHLSLVIPVAVCAAAVSCTHIRWHCMFLLPRLCSCHESHLKFLSRFCTSRLYIPAWFNLPIISSWELLLPFHIELTSPFSCAPIMPALYFYVHIVAFYTGQPVFVSKINLPTSPDCICGRLTPMPSPYVEPQNVQEKTWHIGNAYITLIECRIHILLFSSRLYILIIRQQRSPSSLLLLKHKLAATEM